MHPVITLDAHGAMSLAPAPVRQLTNRAALGVPFATDTQLPRPAVIGPAPARVCETHIGMVFLVGNRAYKLKKPVDVGFLDFRTRESRAECCRREVDLNRRLAPDVYLGVGHLCDPDAAEGEPFVLMRRMPDNRRLSTLVKMGARLDDTVARLARMMAAFHSHSDRSERISAQGSRDAIERRWWASFEQVRPFHDTVLSGGVAAEIQWRVADFLYGRQPLFDRRIADGRIVDGHGDLISDDIFCLDDGPRILDCLEFDDRLRWLDGLDDIAFLAMDLEKLGARRLATSLVERYADFAGDPAPASLLHHFIAYRAFVRVKVDCLRHAQGDRTAAIDARDHADLALRHLRAGTVQMVLIGGLPGAGKSTVAGLVADRLGAVLLSTDRIRKESSGVSPLSKAAGPYGQGLYDREHTTRTYAALLRRADELVRSGESVVLDASWTHDRFRADAGRVAQRSHTRLVQAECWAPPELRRSRLTARHRGLSDADPMVADRMAMDTDPWPAATRLSTTVSPERTATELLTRLATPTDRSAG